MRDALRSLPVISVKKPCPADWEGMAQVAGGRFCSHCGLVVRDLSGLTRDEVDNLVCNAAGRLCVRFERDASGAIKTLDYRARKDEARKSRRWFLAGGMVAMAGAVVNWQWWKRKLKTPGNALAGTVVGKVEPSSRPTSRPAPAPRQMVMGDIAPVFVTSRKRQGR
jgi:hypothetical protein